MTRSEQLFEQFCAANQILCVRVTATKAQTPDFEITLRGVNVSCEIKQIDPSLDDGVNTRISAVAILDGEPRAPSELSLRLYHNPWAANPLTVELFEGLLVAHAVTPRATHVNVREGGENVKTAHDEAAHAVVNYRVVGHVGECCGQSR